MVVHTLIPALGRQRQADLLRFEASLVYSHLSCLAALPHLGIPGISYFSFFFFFFFFFLQLVLGSLNSKLLQWRRYVFWETVQRSTSWQHTQDTQAGHL
jgi:hypothetical protein